MLKKKTFSKTFAGVLRVRNYEKIVDDVTQQALDWINEAGESIDYQDLKIALSSMSAHAIVLYRENTRSSH